MNWIREVTAAEGMVACRYCKAPQGSLCRTLHDGTATRAAHATRIGDARNVLFDRQDKDKIRQEIRQLTKQLVRLEYGDRSVPEIRVRVDVRLEPSAEFITLNITKEKL